MIAEESTEEVWSRLALFQSRDVLERRYKAHHGGELTAGKADEIIAHLQQARQYFLSADSAGVLAGPLEQYYGVLAFARALVLYRQPKQREATLTRGHGIEAAMPAGGSPENIQITVTNGTFRELMEATGNTETVSVDQPSTRGEMTSERFVKHLPAPDLGAQFSLVDLLSRIPEVKEQFEQAFATIAHCHYGRVHVFQASLSTVIWRGEVALPSPDELRQALGVSLIATASVTPNESVDFRAQIKPGENLRDHLSNVIELESRTMHSSNVSQGAG